MAGPDVTQKEVDDAFYKSYGEGSKKGLDPALAGTGGKGRRKLTLDPKDARFRECWMETRRLMRLERGLCVPEGAPIGTPVTPCMKKGPRKDSLKYDPKSWNDGGSIEHSTNCYAYAVNSRTGHAVGVTPQPGRSSGAIAPSPFKCSEVTKAVVADGKPDNILAVDRCPYNKEMKKPPPDKPGYYRVALVVTSHPEGFDSAGTTYHYNDYHWYREDDDGTWSHKPGTFPVRNIDSNSKPITNPELAGRRTVVGSRYNPAIKKVVDEVIDYDIFCGYFWVKSGGAPVK